MRKAEAELAYWESRIQEQGRLSNEHYEYFYTTHFGLDRSFYRGKKILDIGCGPRGSLEWAAETAIRIGVDPLAVAYRRLGTNLHAMGYVACNAENLPFPDAAFEIVCSFNSLDHVDDLGKVIGEIIRVAAAGGTFLLLTDIHAQPTVMEPAAFSWDIIDRFLPVFELAEQRRIEYTVFSPEGYGDMYQSLQRAMPYNIDDPTQRTGILSTRLQKQRQG